MPIKPNYTNKRNLLHGQRQGKIDSSRPSCLGRDRLEYDLHVLGIAGSNVFDSRLALLVLCDNTCAFGFLDASKALQTPSGGLHNLF